MARRLGRHPTYKWVKPRLSFTIKVGKVPANPGQVPDFLLRNHEHLARAPSPTMRVVDRGGDTVSLRGDGSGPHTVENARRKGTLRTPSRLARQGRRVRQRHFCS